MHLDRNEIGKERRSMKKRTRRIIFGIISLVVLAILVMVLYFYIAFSGNPIERFSQQRAIITDYEARYDEDFKIISSSYDYKRNEFSYTISSKNHPEIIFTTTLDEAGRIDKYAAARLRQNQYIVDLSWDPPVVDPLQVDAILADMTLRISKRLDTAIGGLKLRAGVWDGKNYYTTEIDIR